jgi:hypothetical protein
MQHQSYPCAYMRAALTNRKIHEASEIEPKTPDKASCVVNGGPWDIRAASMFRSTPFFLSYDTKVYDNNRVGFTGQMLGKTCSLQNFALQI